MDNVVMNPVSEREVEYRYQEKIEALKRLEFEFLQRLFYNFG